MVIASNSITTIYNNHFSASFQELERYSSITYLTGALTPVACIILKGSMQTDVLERAMELFEKAMVVLNDIASGLSLARTTMKRLRRIVSAVEQTIQNRRMGEARMTLLPENSQMLNLDPGSLPLGSMEAMNQDVFDLFYDDSVFRATLGGDSTVIGV